MSSSGEWILVAAFLAAILEIAAQRYRRPWTFAIYLDVLFVAGIAALICACLGWI